MKKILTVSLFAMMAVSAANAEIASTTYVTDRTGTVSFTAEGATKGKTNLTDAIAAVDAQLQSTSDTLTGDITTQINELAGDISAMDTAYKAADTALDGRVSAAESDIDDLQSGKADKATTLAGYGITDAMTATAITNAISEATDDMATNTGVAASIKEVTDVMATDTELSTAVSTLESKITTAGADTTALAGRVTTAEGKITTIENQQTTQDGKISALETSLSASGTTGKAIAEAQATADAKQDKSTAMSIGAADGEWTDLTKASGYSTTGTHSLVLKNGTIQWEAVSY